MNEKFLYGFLKEAGVMNEAGKITRAVGRAGTALKNSIPGIGKATTEAAKGLGHSTSEIGSGAAGVVKNVANKAQGVASNTAHSVSNSGKGMVHDFKAGLAGKNPETYSRQMAAKKEMAGRQAHRNFHKGSENALVPSGPVHDHSAGGASFKRQAHKESVTNSAPVKTNQTPKNNSKNTPSKEPVKAQTMQDKWNGLSTNKKILAGGAAGVGAGIVGAKMMNGGQEKAASFIDGFYKESEEKKKEHKLRRLIMGNPLSAAIEAKPGHKVEAFRKASFHAGREAIKGAGVGGLIGGLAGAGVGAIKGGKDLAKNMGMLGFGAGASLGTNVGFIKGNIDSKASKIHSEHSKHKK